MKRLSSRRLADAEVHLDAARVAQSEFWKALSDLETCLGIEIESSIDLRDASLEDLLEPTRRRLILGMPEKPYINVG